MTWGFPKKLNMNSFGMFGMFGRQTWDPHMQGAMSGPLCKAISSMWRNSRIYFHKKNTFGGFMVPYILLLPFQTIPKLPELDDWNIYTTGPPCKYR